MRWLALPLASSLVAACFSGCSGTASSDAKTTPVRSPTCLQWQDAMCDYLADRCGQTTRADCDNLLKSMFCKDDATMKACTNAVAAAACGPTPEPCKNVADTAPAIAWCKNFVDAYCTRFDECKMGTKDSCLATSGTAIDCSLAVGIGASADTCMATLPSTPCEQMNQTPAACQGVIKLNQ